MNTPETADEPPARKPGIPRRLALVLSPLVCLVAIPLAHGVVPWALALLGPRYGWTDGAPAVWNLPGLVPVAVGVVVLLWLTVVGYTQTAQLPDLRRPG